MTPTGTIAPTQEDSMPDQPSLDHIMQLGLGFWGSKTLLSAVLYSDPARLRQFLAGMSGISMGAAVSIAQKFPWNNYKTFVDVGGAQGAVPVQVALAHKHMKGANFDLPAVGPIFSDYAKS